MWTSVQRCLTTAASTLSARTPWGRINVSASRATKETANIVKVRDLVDRPLFFVVVGKMFFRDGLLLFLGIKATYYMLIFSYPCKYKPISKWQACLKPLSRRPQLVGFKISQRRTGMRPSAEGFFVTRWNEPVNFIYIFEERIKIVAETAVRMAAKRSRIFPQPEADLAVCQKQVCFLSLFNMPKAPRSLCPTIFISIITKPYFTM